MAAPALSSFRLKFSFYSVLKLAKTRATGWQQEKIDNSLAQNFLDKKKQKKSTKKGQKKGELKGKFKSTY